MTNEVHFGKKVARKSTIWDYGEKSKLLNQSKCLGGNSFQVKEDPLLWIICFMKGDESSRGSNFKLVRLHSNPMRLFKIQPCPMAKLLEGRKEGSTLAFDPSYTTLAKLMFSSFKQFRSPLCVCMCWPFIVKVSPNTIGLYEVSGDKSYQALRIIL